MIPLYPYQQRLVNDMYQIGSCLNRSKGGSGKTRMALAVVERYNSHSNLVIVPNPKLMLDQWASEVHNLLPGYEVFVIKGTPKQRAAILREAEDTRSPHFVICSYEIARIELQYLTSKEWGIVTLDEVHRMKSVRSKTWKTIKEIKAKRRYGLSATPTPNGSPLEMYGVIDFIRPNLLGAYWPFLQRYCVKDFFNHIKHFRNMEELAHKVAPYIVTATDEEMNLQLPPVIEQDLLVQFSDKERKLYNKMRMELLHEIEAVDVSHLSSPVILQNALTKVGKLFELTDSMELLGDNKDSSKLEVLKELLADLPSTDKVIIISRFKRMCTILNRELGGLMITGDTKDSRAVVAQFAQTDERILVGSTALEQGVDGLQVANVLVNFDPAWSDSRMDQRRWRIERNGQTKTVLVYNLLVEKSVDTNQAKKIINKAALSKSMLLEILR